jgi:hypothetical protein
MLLVLDSVLDLQKVLSDVSNATIVSRLLEGAKNGLNVFGAELTNGCEVNGDVEEAGGIAAGVKGLTAGAGVGSFGMSSQLINASSCC